MIESAAGPRLADRAWFGDSLAGRAWQAFLFFLEVVGLRRERTGQPEAQLARLRLNHAEFRKLLSANDSFLHSLAGLEAGRAGRYGVDGTWVHRRVVRAAADVFRMVESLDAISESRYPALRATYQRVSAALTAVVREAGGGPRERLVLDLADLLGHQADRAGGKMANLGEVRNAVGLPTPEGFVVTTDAYHLLARGSAPDEAPPEVEKPAAPPPATAVPAEIRAAIEDAYDRLEARLGAPPRLAVRSSALGEDGRRSYAGQFLSVLDVPRQQLAAAYLDVVKSLDSPHATEYRRMHGIPEDCAAMAVGFLAMVDARVAGITYSREPDHPDSGRVLIQVVRGLGVTLADGGSWAEAIRVSRDGRVTRARGEQVERVVCGETPGVRTEPLGPEAHGEPCLADEEARQLARWALVLEGHFGLPQDIEWARDEAGRLWLLQARPLRTALAPAPSRGPAPGALVLVRGGETACPGVGTGPATLVEPDDDLSDFPIGGVLVVRRPSPSFVRLMGRAAAIVSDAGSATGHMANLAREFGVPTLLDLETAVRDIPAGAEVTVDASAGFVYAGKVDLPQAAPSRPDAGPQPQGRETETQRLLDRVMELIVPLSLTDPRSPSFSLEGCQTLHDLARYVHERSYAEMFRMGDHLQDLRDASYFLEVFLPMELYVIDLGGAVDGPVSGRRLKLPQVACLPLSRLLQGMLDRRIPRFGTRPIDMGGLVSVMLRHALTSPEQDPTFRDPCYAMASDSYLNYTARVGYHFGVVDTYCSPTPNRNYVTFRFKGGAADRVRRARRARAIAGILRREGFTVEVEGDLVGARLSKASREEILSRLEMLGRLLQFFRQMDAAMGSDEAADQIQEAFLSGDFALAGARRETA